jgi:hypothetical protein
MTFPRRSFPLILIIALTAACQGCRSTGALWYKMFGPSKVPAKFALAKVPTLVVVENFRNPAMTEFDADRIAREVVDDLKKNDTAPMIDQDRLTAIRESNASTFRDMSIPAVGRAAEATQVIYVDLQQSSVEGDATRGIVRGRAEARVRVVDVKTGNTIWPIEAQTGYPVGAEVPYTQSDDPSAANEVHNALLESLSEQIGRLFHAWKPETEKEGEAG